MFFDLKFYELNISYSCFLYETEINACKNIKRNELSSLPDLKCTICFCKWDRQLIIFRDGCVSVYKYQSQNYLCAAHDVYTYG